MNIQKLSNIIAAGIRTATEDRIIEAGEGIRVDIRKGENGFYHHDTIFAPKAHHSLCFCGDCPTVKPKHRTKKVTAGWARVGRIYLVNGKPDVLQSVGHSAHFMVFRFASGAELALKGSEKMKEVVK